MCGICGIVQGKEVDYSVIENMTMVLRHRGPDSQNIKLLGNVAFGHARLSIIDLSTTANQPLSNEDDSIWLTYNGEFYTFEKYRKELVEKGHKFKTNTDSEVIIHLYEEYGIGFVHMLHGMFAIALYDTRDDKIILVRDRVGKKPLYYYHKNGILLFASEIKSILEYPGVSNELDQEALRMYFTFGYIAGERSIYKEVKKLPSAHYMIYEKKSVSISRYWSLPERIHDYSETDAKVQLDKLLNDAVKMRMISDVPIGALLSGGVDSSLISAIMSKHSDKPIKTFSISFSDSNFNEIEHARKVANHIGSEHYEFNVNIEDSEIIEKLMYYFDEPFADSSAIPTYFVSKMAGEHVTVILSGDGGDELFGGYNWYDWMFKKSSYDSIPLPLRKGVGKISSALKGKYPGKHFLSILGYSEFDTFMERTTFFNSKELSHLLNNHGEFSFLKEYQEFYSEGSTLLQRLTRTDFNYYLPDDILTKVDRASMAVSLEARVPILDQKVCEFAFSLPDNLKVKNRDRKYLLKQLAKDYLPNDFDYTRKQGFSLPQSDWLKIKYSDVILDLISSSPILNIHYVQTLVNEHKTGIRNNSKRLWPILIFLLWNNSN